MTSLNLRYTTTSKTMGGCNFTFVDVANKRLIFGQSATAQKDMAQETPFDIEVTQKKMIAITEYFQAVGFKLVSVNQMSLQELTDLKYNNLDLLYGKK